jgi:hypothetical protein
MLTESCQKDASRFCCEFCYYFTDKKSSYDKHLLTSKHIKLTNVNTISIKSCYKIADIKEFICGSCNKCFKSRVGLWKHQKNCDLEKNNIIIPKEEPTDKELILKILKQNSELIKENSELRKEQTDIKELILEIVKNGTHITNNNNNTTNTNSHNKAFNLNFFLNETCKNAMNITDFVDSIKLQLSDLIEVGELGYVEGISKIIVKNLNNLDESIRPIHCTDKKRETMYIKDQGQWEKEDDNKTKLKKAVIKVADKNLKLLPAFREKYPEYKNSASKVSDKYDKMVIEVMTCDDSKNEKIVHNISKVTTIK